MSADPVGVVGGEPREGGIEPRSVGSLAPRRWLSIALNVIRAGPILILILLAATMAMLSPTFLTETNLQNLGTQTSVVALLAVGQLFVIVTRGIDLSVGSTVALSTVACALVFESASGPIAIAAMVLVGASVGLINGVVFVKGRIPHAFIVTLAMLNVASGLAFILSDGATITGVPGALGDLAANTVGPVPVPVLLVAAFSTLAVALSRRMQWGRWIYAVGGSPEAARRVGIPVNRVLISVYVFSGVSAGMAAGIVAGRTNSGFPTAGQLLELDAIAAAIIGGASFFGGRGWVTNALVGALILGTIRNGLNLQNVNPAWQLVVIGAVVALAVELDVLRRIFEDRLRALSAEGPNG